MFEPLLPGLLLHILHKLVLTINIVWKHCRDVAVWLTILLSLVICVSIIKIHLRYGEIIYKSLLFYFVLIYFIYLFIYLLIYLFIDI